MVCAAPHLSLLIFLLSAFDQHTIYFKYFPLIPFPQCYVSSMVRSLFNLYCILAPRIQCAKMGICVGRLL